MNLKQLVGQAAIRTVESELFNETINSIQELLGARDGELAIEFFDDDYWTLSYSDRMNRIWAYILQEQKKLSLVEPEAYEYTIVWEYETSATSREDAAQQAFEVMRSMRPGGANFLSVTKEGEVQAEPEEYTPVMPEPIVVVLRSEMSTECPTICVQVNAKPGRGHYDLTEEMAVLDQLAKVEAVKIWTDHTPGDLEMIAAFRNADDFWVAQFLD
jgi:hypothetical protein